MEEDEQQSSASSDEETVEGGEFSSYREELFAASKHPKGSFEWIEEQAPLFKTPLRWPRKATGRTIKILDGPIENATHPVNDKLVVRRNRAYRIQHQEAPGRAYFRVTTIYPAEHVGYDVVGHLLFENAVLQGIVPDVEAEVTLLADTVFGDNEPLHEQALVAFPI